MTESDILPFKMKYECVEVTTLNAFNHANVIDWMHNGSACFDEDQNAIIFNNFGSEKKITAHAGDFIMRGKSGTLVVFSPIEYLDSGIGTMKNPTVHRDL